MEARTLRRLASRRHTHRTENGYSITVARTKHLFHVSRCSAHDAAQKRRIIRAEEAA